MGSYTIKILTKTEEKNIFSIIDIFILK